MINHEGSSGAMEKEAAKVKLGTPLSLTGLEARRAFGPSTHYRITGKYLCEK